MSAREAYQQKIIWQIDKKKKIVQQKKRLGFLL